MRDAAQELQTLTRRTVLGLGGLAVLGGGVFAHGSADSDASVSLDEACSTATVEMQPSDGRVLTGVIESVDGSEVVRTPPGGQTVTAGGSTTIQYAFSSPDGHIERAYVVEGRGLEGPIVKETACENADGHDAHETNDGTVVQRSSSQSQSVSVSQSSQDSSADIDVDVETLLEILRRYLRIEW
jgi:hypothetical protein